MAKRVLVPTETRPKQRPASTATGREAQMVNLAIDLAEEQLRNGTASSQVIVHFLKLGTEKEKLERQKLEMETEKLKAQKEVLEASKRTDEMYDKAIAAMRTYMGIAEEVDGDPYILGVD